VHVISLFNSKGGVGKTATAVNLAYLAASSGRRVLIWDLDPQGATSFYFRVKPKVKGGAKKIAKGKSDLDDLIKDTGIENLDLIPADLSYREFDIRLSGEKSTALKKMVAPLEHDYDLVFFDCAPSMSALSERVLRATDLLMVPVIPTTLSLRALDQLERLIDDVKTGDLTVRWFYSMVDRRKKMHRELVLGSEGAARTGSSKPLTSSIPYSSLVERMGIERRPVVDFAPRSAPALAFRDLWDEVVPLVSR